MRPILAGLLAVQHVGDILLERSVTASTDERGEIVDVQLTDVVEHLDVPGRRVLELRVFLHTDRTQRREHGERPRFVDKRLVGCVRANLFFERRGAEPFDVVQEVFGLILAVDDVSIVATRKQLVDACLSVLQRERCDPIRHVFVVSWCTRTHSSITSGVADCTSNAGLSMGWTMLQTSVWSE